MKPLRSVDLNPIQLVDILDKLHLRLTSQSVLAMGADKSIRTITIGLVSRQLLQMLIDLNESL